MEVLVEFHKDSNSYLSFKLNKIEIETHQPLTGVLYAQANRTNLSNLCDTHSKQNLRMSSIMSKPSKTSLEVLEEISSICQGCHFPQKRKDLSPLGTN